MYLEQKTVIFKQYVSCIVRTAVSLIQLIKSTSMVTVNNYFVLCETVYVQFCATQLVNKNHPNLTLSTAQLNKYRPKAC